MAVVLPVYTITGGELTVAFYNAVAAMFQYLGVMGLFKTAIGLGGIWTVGQFIVSRNVRSMFLFVLKYALVIAFVLTPKSTVQIFDRTDPMTTLSVDNVPLILGAIGSLSSSLSNRVTQTFELFFHAPNDMDYSQTGMIMGAKLFLSASQIKITDPSFNSNMQKFMQQCVFYDLMYGRYDLKELNASVDLWTLVKEKASVARGFIYDGSFKSCMEAANLLDGAWTSVIADAKSKYAGFYFGNRTETLANFEKYLPQTYQYLTKLSLDAANIIRQNMMANALRDGVFAMGSRLNSKSAIESFSASRAQEKIPAALSNIGLMAAYWLPVIQSAMFCIVIGCFIFVLFFFPFPFGLSFFQFYTTLYIWLSLWAPVATIINYIMTILAKYSLSYASVGATTLAYQTGINQMYEHLAAVGGYLTVLSIGISYMLISRRVDSLMSASQQIGGIVQNAATSSAEEAQTGNYNYGNTSFANHHSFNAHSFNQDQNARISMGNVETSLDGGSVARMARNGSETLSMSSAMSHTPLNIQLGESTRSAFSELSDKAIQASYVQSNAASEQYGASLRSLAELGQTQMHSEQSSDGASISNSVGFNTAASKVSNLVDQFAQDHNMSRDEAIKTFTALSANGGISARIGLPFKAFGSSIEVGANARMERDHSHSTQEAHLASDAQRFSQENHFNDVVNEARQATKDSHFRTSDDKSGRLADSFTSGYDKAMHYREEASASLSQSEGYHRQATLAKEQTSSINLDAQTGFVDWLSQHKAPNSSGNIGLQQAEWMIRNEPEMAQAYARQYVGEKTSQSIHQFQQHHALNTSHVEQAHSRNQQQISNERVNERLTQYNSELNERAKGVDVGQVNPSYSQVVEKEMTQANKELHQRTQTVVDGGEQVMQGVIVTEANQWKK
jgi:conjugal transfer mating pair stabilization protein TraG